MDEDFLDVTEKSHKVGIIFVLAIVILAVCGYFFVFRKYYFSIKNVEVEVGSEISTDIKDYIRDVSNYDDYKLNLSDVNTNEVGEYTYTISSNSITRKGKIKVIDSKAPVFTLKEVTIEEGTSDFYLGDFLETCEDYSVPCLVNLKNAKDEEKFLVKGTYTIGIEISDTRGNKTSAEATLNVVEKGTIVNQASKDLEYASNSENIENFSGTVFKKLDVAVPAGSEQESGIIAEMSTIDLEKYVRENYEGYSIKDTTIIKLYNKSSYTIGFSIQITLSDSRMIYVDPSKVTSSNE